MHAFLQKPNNVQRTSSNVTSSAVVGKVLRSPGQPLDQSLQASMSSRFHFDFSRVRIHQDTQAAESASAVSARAYTVGHNVVFGSGQYSPATTPGRGLLAHELTHVVQQSSAGPAAMQGFTMETAGSPGEREAHAAADAINTGTSMPPISRMSGIGLQRAAISNKEHFLDLGDLDHGLDMCDHLACNDVNACQDDEKGIECPEGTKHAFSKTNHKFLRHLSCDQECKKGTVPCDNNEQVIALPKGRVGKGKKKCGQELTICANGKSTSATVREHSERNSWEVSGAVARALGVDPDFHGSLYPESNDADMKDDPKCTPKSAPSPKAPTTPPKKTEK